MDFKCYRCGSWPCTCKDGQTIIHGDCREVLPHLGTFDLLLTDPPYGINAGNLSFGKWRTSKMKKGDWDACADTPLIEKAAGLAKHSIVWGGNYFSLPPRRCFFVWDKGAGFKGRDFAECEQAWCSWDGNAKTFHRDPLAMGDYRGKQHPTQKPLALMRWCIQQAPDDPTTVIDPFIGSGTTLRAAKDLGCWATGIELEERYCQIAADRLRQEVLF